jgi:hypothetical protein
MAAPYADGSPVADALPAGPTVIELQAAFPGRALRQVDPIAFQRLVAAHPDRGRLLTGPELAAFTAATKPASSHEEPRRNPAIFSFKDSVAYGDSAEGPAPAVRARMPQADTARQDTTAFQPHDGRPAAHGDDRPHVFGNDSAVREDAIPGGMAKGARAETDATEYERERAKGWFFNFFADASDGHASWDGGDWAAILYVVIGVVVVGAFLVYGVQTLYDLAVNENDDPVFMEAGVRMSYSGKAFRDPSGRDDLYRDAYLAGLRFAIGIDRPGMDLGLAVEGGYIDVYLKGMSNPAKAFDFKGGYLVAGPMLRFGRNDPLSFSLEFLNGTSNHANIGWISKSRMALQTKVGSHTLLGAHLGAVFYDLHFLDGLGWRNGDFNRDVSLVYGLDAGWEF